METKVCSKCREEKPMTTEYYLFRKDNGKFRNDCNDCRKQYNKSLYIEPKHRNIPTEQECNVCNLVKSADNFGNNPVSKNGLKGYCKYCEAERARNRRALKPKRKTITEIALETGIKLCNGCNISKPLNQFWKNPSKRVGVSCRCIECDKKYRNTNLSHYNYEYQKKYRKNKLDNDPVYRLMKNLSRRIRKFVKKDNKTTQKILGCSKEFFMNWIENQFQPGMTWDNYGQYGWHLDHIIPLSTANTEQEIYKLNHYTNFQPLWWEQNLSKGDKLPNQFGNVFVS